MVQVAAGEEDRQLSVQNPIFVSLLTSTGPGECTLRYTQERFLKSNKKRP